MSQYRLNLFIPHEHAKRLDELAAKKGVSKSSIVAAALASWLSPDAGDQREAAIAKRLDKLDRRMTRMERDVGISVEMIALFVRFWLSNTPPPPESERAAMRRQGGDRYDAFMEALGRRLAKGPKVTQEIGEDFPAKEE